MSVTCSVFGHKYPQNTETSTSKSMQKCIRCNFETKSKITTSEIYSESTDKPEPEPEPEPEPDPDPDPEHTDQLNNAPETNSDKNTANMTNLSNSTSSNNNVSISRPSQKQSSSTDEQTDKPETETNWKETKDEGVSIMPQEKNQSQKSIQTHHTNSNGAVKSQMDSKSTEHTERMAELRTKSNSPTEQVDSAIESNQQVICESCGFTDEDESSMSFWTGDSCPKCRKDYLVDITQR